MSGNHWVLILCFFFAFFLLDSYSTGISVIFFTTKNINHTPELPWIW